MVKTPPLRSSKEILPSRAFVAYPARRDSMSAKLRRSQSRTTGTISPRSVPTATPISYTVLVTRSSPSIRELIEGIAWSASTTALMKKLMKPSLTPCFFVNSSWSSLRRAITALISHSLNVVRMAAVCCAITSWVAILRRRGESFFRTVRDSSPDAETTGAGFTAMIGAGAGAGVAATAFSTTAGFADSGAAAFEGAVA